MAGKATRPSSARRARAAQYTPIWAPTAEAAEREIWRTRKSRYHRHRKRALTIIMAISLGLGYLAFWYGFELVEVRGAGMSPTLESGSLVLCIKQKALDELVGIVPEDMRRIGRGDVVLIDYKAPPVDESDESGDSEERVQLPSALLIKRAVGMGGDEIDIAGGEIIVAREEIAGKIGESDLVYPVVVPTGRMFALGDNRALSVDSRLRAFGMTAEADVIARPVAVIWPVYAIGLVK